MSRAQKIHFFSIKKNFHVKYETRLRRLIGKILRSKKRKLQELTVVFCSDSYLLKINQDYLGHDYYTDIITFNLADRGKPIQGEIYVSIDRVKSNAKQLGVNRGEELIRVIIHGILHLCGFKDKTQAEKKKMRAAEESFLAKF